MNLKELKKDLIELYKKGVKKPPFLIGERGIGKTSLVKQIGEELNLPVVHLRLAEMEEGDLIGIPREKNGKTVYLRPEWMLEEPFLLFLDELNRQLRVEVLNAVTQLVEQYRIHTHSLPEGSWVICAGNPATGMYDTTKLDPAWEDRVQTIYIEFDYESFHEYIIKEKWNHILIKFLENHRELIFQTPNQEKKTPSPRGWETVNQLLQTEFIRKPITHSMIEWVAANVGNEASLIFVEFFEKEELQIDPDEFFRKYENFIKEIKTAQEQNRNDKISVAIENIVEKIETLPETEINKTVEKIKKFIKEDGINDSFKILLLQMIINRIENNNETNLTKIYEKLALDSEIIEEIKKIMPE